VSSPEIPLGSDAAGDTEAAVSIDGNPLPGSGHEKSVEPSDAILWMRARLDDADAFGVLFERHAKLIYNYCFRCVGNRATAQDLLSLVFLEAWRRRDTELRLETALPFLYGIASNVIRHQRRSERRFKAAVGRLPRPLAEPDFAGDAAERMDIERQACEARDALRTLPRREQDVFVLCVGMELSYEEAAAALGLPIGTVRSRLSRARGRLRELELGGGHKEGESKKYKEASQP
jgi:RNA polymerase sigma factor (sigma-70 family)